MLSVGLNALFHFSEKTVMVTKKTCRTKIRFYALCWSQGVVSLFRKNVSVTILKIFDFGMINSNNIYYYKVVLLPTVKKEGTFFEKKRKPPFWEIRKKWLMKSYHLPNHLVSTQKTYFRTLLKSLQ